MPLPKPPTKRADMLTDVDFTSQPKAAKTTVKSTSKSAPSGNARQNVAAILSAPTPAPTLELVKPAKAPAAAPTATVSEAPRARHQCVAARPDVAVPFRRARHLPAHDHARRAGRAQKGHDRSGAQRP